MKILLTLLFVTNIYSANKEIDEQINKFLKMTEENMYRKWPKKKELDSLKSNFDINKVSSIWN